MDRETLLKEFPILEKEDITEALAFAAAALDESYLALQPAAA